MSGCYAYCVLPAGSTPPAALRGIDGAAVVPFDAAGLTLWVSTLATRPQPELARIRSHNAVVEAADFAPATLPLRFGQWLPDAAALERHAASRADAWRMQLAELAGCCEFGVRITLHAAAGGRGPARDVQRPNTSGAGRAYMERLAARQAEHAGRREQGERVVAILRERLAGLVRRERIEDVGAAALSVAHLVKRADVAAYRAGADALRIEPGVELVVTGPWPPYSFVQ